MANPHGNDRGARWVDGDPTTGDIARATTDEGSSQAEVQHSRNYVWDGISAWVRMTQPGGGTGGGGGAVTIADGADVAQGTTTDLSTANTVVGLLKAIKAAVQGTLTVGTHAVTQSGGPWTSNVTQFGGVNISTGTGAGGTGIPRVTISNDSSLAANQSVNTAQFGGTNVSTGTGAGGAGIPRVTVSNDSNVLATQSGTWTVQPGNTANTTAWKVDGSAVTQPVSLATGGGKTLAFASVSVAASGQNAIVAADATRKIKVYAYVLVADAAVTAKWQNASTDLTGPMSLAANGGVSAIGLPSGHLMETSVNQALNLNLGSAVGVRGHIAYFLE